MDRVATVLAEGELEDFPDGLDGNVDATSAQPSTQPLEVATEMVGTLLTRVFLHDPGGDERFINECEHGSGRNLTFDLKPVAP